MNIIKVPRCTQDIYYLFKNWFHCAPKCEDCNWEMENSSTKLSSLDCPGLPHAFLHGACSTAAHKPPGPYLKIHVSGVTSSPNRRGAENDHKHEVVVMDSAVICSYWRVELLLHAWYTSWILPGTVQYNIPTQCPVYVVVYTKICLMKHQIVAGQLNLISGLYCLPTTWIMVVTAP